MKRFLRTCLNQTMRKRVDESKLDIKHIAIPEKDISYFNLSSNLIISFCHQGKQYYFRECPRNLKRQLFFQREISRFFDTLDRLHINGEHFKQEALISVDFSEDAEAAFRAYIENKQKCSGYWKVLSNTDIISRNMNFSIWESRDYDAAFFEAYGMADLPENCREIGVYFLWCMRGACQTFRTLRVACGKAYSYFSAVKSVASKIVAEALGIGSLITDTSFCCVKTDSGQTLFGLLCDAAPGSRMVDSEVEICGSLQKELMNLSLLDLICVQTDHGPNNYNISATNGAYTVCAFDNDNPNTFLPLPFVNRSVLGCSKMVDADGLLNRPYISRDLYDRIQNVDAARLRRELSPYLNILQISALMIRIKHLQKVLKKTAEKKRDFLLEDAAWSLQTAAEEMSGNYGRTYLTIAS